jgi:hypothetical protein
MNKFIRILGIVLLAVSAIFGIIFYAGPETASGAPTITNTILIWAGILAGVAAILSMIFPLIQMIMHPKKARGSLIGIIVLVVLGLVSYALASSEPLAFPKPEPNNVPTILKQAGMGIITMYILLGLGILSIIFTEISKVFK